MIVDEDVVRVREASDLVAVAGQHMALKRVGRRQVGLCPFHAEKTPSFSVNAEEGLYYCFGCQASGDVFTFVIETEHLDFPGAVEFLAGKAGISLHYTRQGETEGRKRRARLIEAMEEAVEWYHQRLLSADDAKPARRYLRQRGLEGDVVRAYRLGWAPDDWDALSRALDIGTEVLSDTGLGFVNSRNRRQDSFRARLLFPIFDPSGDPVAFGGRVLPGGEGPKYKNSAESAIYAKSKVLYGLNWAKASIVEADQVIVCEGYTDVIGLASAGIPRAVATCGTALTESHVQALARFAKAIVLAFDADAAGLAAAERVYEWERAHEIDVSVADLPAGVDPAELARGDPERLRQAIEGATPLLGFRLEQVLASGDLTSPEGQAHVADRAVEVIREHPDPLVRDQYVMKAADRVRVEASQLRERLARQPDAAPEAVIDLRQAPTGGPARETPEVEALRLAVHRPTAVAPLLEASLFADPLHRAAYDALAAASTLQQALADAPPEVAALLRRLAVEDADDDAEEVVARLVDESVSRCIRALEAEARRTGELVDVAWPKLRVEALRDPGGRVEATDQLLAWLSERPEEIA